MARAVPRGHGLSFAVVESSWFELPDSFRLSSETSVPTGRGSCACHLGVCLSAPGSVGRPRPLRSPASPSACSICPSSCLPGQREPGDYQPLAVVMGSRDPVLGYCVLSVQSKDAYAGLPNSKAELRNQAPTRPAHCPSGLFPLGEKVGQLCSGLGWTFGTVGARLALYPLPPHISSWLWQGPEVCVEPAVGQLVRMAAKAPVALPSGCQALKFPVDHNSN